MTAPRKLRHAAKLALAVIGCITAFEAGAAITCSVSVSAMTVVYDPTVSGDTVATGSYTLSCARLSGDPNTLSWSLGANDGLQPTGQTNRVALSGLFYTYELYRLAPYTNPNRWRDANDGVRFIGTLNFGASLTASQSGPFDMRIAGPQTVQPAGTYTDVVTATLRNSAGAGTILNTTTFGVSVITTPSCQIAVPPGNVNFTYTSFQAAAAAANTSFGTRCTTGLPYTMALDATSVTDNALNLAYTLALSAAGGTGTGITQTYSVNGSMAGGQSGTCATATCTNATATNKIRTLTISY